MIHYHGTPITPRLVLLELAGKHFCVSFAHPQDASACHQIGQSVMLDNGAFSFWTKGRPVNWFDYYESAEQWLDYRTTWAVIPDIIDGGVNNLRGNEMLIARCPFSVHQSAPVWHLHECPSRILHFLDLGYNRVCFGSSEQYSEVGSTKWHQRITEAFNLLARNGPIPWVHMLRGMAMAGSQYPFSSVDSTDVARNHNRKNNALTMANRWDAMQCPPRWIPQPIQMELK